MRRIPIAARRRRRCSLAVLPRSSPPAAAPAERRRRRSRRAAAAGSRSSCPSRRWSSGPRRRWSISTPAAWCAAQRLAAARRSVLPPFFGDRSLGPAAGAGAELARLRRDRRRRRPDRHQQPCGRAAPTRSRSCSPTGANSRPRSLRADERTDLAVLRIDTRRREAAALRCAIPTSSRSAISCSPSAIRSASARPSPAASSRRWRAPRSASPISASSSRPTPRSIPAIPAARWSPWTASWSASTRRSSRAAAARSASASPSRPTWCATVVDGVGRGRQAGAALARRRRARR